jgi:HEAT repeat protein
LATKIKPGSAAKKNLADFAAREPRSDRFAVVRAVAAHPSEPVNAELLTLLASDDRQLAAAAAVSLGAPGNDAAVAPLAKLLGDEQERVRMASIRGLGRIATPEAKQALAEAAESHPDPRTRGRAAAELALLGRREAQVQRGAQTKSEARSP